jgi:hypothetical protein
MSHEIEQAIALVPRPRGEGVWAWTRYYLFKARNFWDGDRTCEVPGCPNGIIPCMPTRRCDKHR